MISNRLKQIANYIDDDHDVADIGSDHGLLLVLLSNRNFSKKVLGVENKKGPFENLKNTVNQINKANFLVSFSNGLNDVPSSYQTIVIAGMGYENIKNIVESDIFNGNKRQTFIIDCHTNQTNIRGFFYNLGYKISNETVVYEDNIYYDLIKFVINDNHVTYNNIELEYGPLNLKNKNDIFIKKCKEQLSKFTDIVEKVNDKSKTKKIERKIKILEAIIDED